jgi:hypothetical protein
MQPQFDAIADVDHCFLTCHSSFLIGAISEDVDDVIEPHQRDCRKTYFSDEAHGPLRRMRPISASERGGGGHQGWMDLVECPKRVDLADIVYQSEQPPLYIHVQLGT